MAERSTAARVFDGVQGAAALAAAATIGRGDGKFGRFVLKPTLATLGTALLGSALLRPSSAKAEGAKPEPAPTPAPAQRTPELGVNQGTPLEIGGLITAAAGAVAGGVGVSKLTQPYAPPAVKAAGRVLTAIGIPTMFAGVAGYVAGNVKATTPAPSGSADLARQAAARTAADMGATQVLGTFSGGAAPGSGGAEPARKGRVDAYTRMQNGQMVQVSGYQLPR